LALAARRVGGCCRFPLLARGRRPG
jgi:hypothetical protein